MEVVADGTNRHGCPNKHLRKSSLLWCLVEKDNKDAVGHHIILKACDLLYYNFE